MRMIWKFTVPHPMSRDDVFMPPGARILAVGEQNNRLVVWAEVDPRSTQVKRAIRVYPTGSEVLRDDVYIGTVQVRGEIPGHPGEHTELVWHVYDGGER